MNPLLPRADYPTLRDVVYLNQASLGLVGQPAASAMHQFLDDVARHGNLHMSDSDEVAYFERLRQVGAQLFNCRQRDVAIVASASEFLGQLPHLLCPPAGSHIILVASDFPAVTRPWLQYAAEQQWEVDFVEDEQAVSLTDAIVSRIEERTAVVAVSHVQFATGSCVDVAKLRRVTTAVGAALIIDATQAAGLMRTDSSAWQADAVVASGYKWLGGHGGAALAVLGSALQEKLPLSAGWMGAPEPFDFDATQVEFAPDARKFTQSTMSYLSLTGLAVAIEQLNAIEADLREAFARNLAVTLALAIEPLGWEAYRPVASPSAAPHIITIAHPNHAAIDAYNHLRQQGIVCGTRNGRLRISLALYNNQHDIERFAAALAQI